MDAQQEQLQEQKVKTNRIIFIFKSVGTFLWGTANALTKAAICLGTLMAFVEYPERIPAWALVAIVAGVYSVDLAKSVRIKSPWIEISFDHDSSSKDDKPKE